MRQQIIITKNKSGSELYHFIHSPHSIGSLQSYLDDGWVLKFVFDDIQGNKGEEYLVAKTFILETTATQKRFALLIKKTQYDQKHIRDLSNAVNLK